MRIIYVHENWSGDNPILIGRLYADPVRNGEKISFEYDQKYLNNCKNMYFLDPDLKFYEGRQYPIGKSIFGMLADTSPDRWGRVLMKRRERVYAEKENRKPKLLMKCTPILGHTNKV